MTEEQRKAVSFAVNLALCIAGVFAVLAFAVGIEHDRSAANEMIKIMRRHDLAIVFLLLGMCGLLCLPLILKRK